MFNEFEVSLTIDRPVPDVWNQLVDWRSQGDWMLLTRVEASDSGSADSGIGTTIDAFTGIGRFGILDRMRIVKWEPPRFCEVIHYGRWIKGIGRFTLVDIGDGKTRFDWYEQIEAPKPVIALIKPGILIAVRLSLRKFAKSLG